MEKLHLRNPKKYDYSDEAAVESPRIKFYCVSEGPTEESYFWGVKNNRKNLKIKNDVHIEIIPKQEGQETLSHPVQLIDACLRAMGCIDPSGEEIAKEKWDDYCQWNGFDREKDQVCVIFDRDYRNLDTKLNDIFQLCEKYGIRIVMSNPNFELWLLMHFPDIQKYDREMMLRNKKNLGHRLFPEASSRKKYLEILLSKRGEGYAKGCKLNFEKYMHSVDLAVEQAKAYCEDTKKLVYELGTAVGLLIRDMRS